MSSSVKEGRQAGPSECQLQVGALGCSRAFQGPKCAGGQKLLQETSSEGTRHEPHTQNRPSPNAAQPPKVPVQVQRQNQLCLVALAASGWHCRAALCCWRARAPGRKLGAPWASGLHGDSSIWATGCRERPLCPTATSTASLGSLA